MHFSKIYFAAEFIIARLIIYATLPIFYFYLVFINTSSCGEGKTCILCNMKTAVWELLHFNLREAISLNPLVVYVLAAIIYIIIDLSLIITYVRSNLKREAD